MSMAQDLYGHLKTAKAVANTYRAELGEIDIPETDFVLRVAFSLWIEENKERRGQAAQAARSGGGGHNYTPGPDGKPTPYKCPECGGDVIDQRDTRRNPKAPDFKCTSCKNAQGYYTGFYLEARDGTRRTPEQLFGASAAQAAGHEFSDESLSGEDTLPF